MSAGIQISGLQLFARQLAAPLANPDYRGGEGCGLYLLALNLAQQQPLV
jgi:hypothetical protein